MALQPNRFGLGEAVVGFAASFVVAEVAVSVFGAATHHLSHPGTFGADVTSLLALWSCWIAAALYASAAWRRSLRHQSPPAGRPPTPEPLATAPPADTALAPALLPAPGGAIRGRIARGGAPAAIATAAARLREDYGLVLRPWPDIPLGIAVGVASQYVLVPILELPLLPFVPHLYHRLGSPAHQLTAGASGASLALLGVLVCVGSPVVEELFFRGLLLRAIAGRLPGLRPDLRAVLSVLIVSVVFGLAHFEALQLIGLIGFGAVLGTLAWRTGRLGPGIVAHAAFNTVTIVALALAR